MSPEAASHPLEVSGVVELALVERNGLIESRHVGAAVVVSADGTVVRALGDVDALVYPRSSLKPFQAMAVLRSGARLDGAQLVLASASHAGTPEHVRVVGELLARAGLGEDALQCPLDWPLDPQSQAVARTSGAPRRVTMNCSGKHASFLLACVHNGWPIENYLDPAHPLQLLVRKTVEEFTGEPVGQVGVDGCGAPLFAVTLRGLATAVSRVAQGISVHGPDPDAARLTDAIVHNAWAIDGPGRANTVVIEELGLLTKGGAEGVMVMAAPDGTAVALKILDGTQRATTLVALELLAQAGAVPRAEADRVAALTTEKVLGKGVPVGAIRTVF
ncbi:MAG TPA: asparaginase [Terrimesophilobacter sp.]|uniref:asparaginase n=1 Tax=Terrimesophilobacter sp. TaxID=2906435 RepID=UPI002F941552